ncbi:LacI family DNA-binding transcriptional regulator [Pseudalkalibacillus decolorationis]|uniref:LacI family DNA-binding transcriptional regulator n=1 Tax=Pseudalkalibacillus decolorationis TaxID=163879 RepID=UPI002148335A|nr:LacI family DNA-binding transcriptional regulator [Pseudalkalibacillus decolorationis]
MTTIADVAKHAGLSRATVSRVINNYQYVTEEKKKLVRDAMNELGYYPNSSAQRLRNQKTNMIAILVPRLTNPFFTNIIEGIEKVAAENGLQLLICQTKSDKQKELNYFKLLKTKQVDGIILTAIENDWEKFSPFLDCGPIVLCNEYDEEATVPMIRLNQFEGSYIGTRHLIERGHRKIGYCGGGSMSGLSTDRKNGLKKALEDIGLTLNPDWIFLKRYSIEDGQKVMKEIAAMDDRPTAIFTGSDEVAAGVIKESKNSGIKVPEDLAVIGFDNQPIAEMIEPGLTTIEQPSEEIGEKAMETMVAVLNEQKFDTSLNGLSLELVVRDST